MEIERNERQAKLMLFIGVPGCGKSQLARTFVNKALANDIRVLIISPGFKDWTYKNRAGQIITDKKAIELKQPGRIPLIDLNTDTLLKFTGAARAYANKKTIGRIEKYTKGVLILDDCKPFLNSSLQEDLELLISRLRHHQVDTISIGHGFNKIPAAFYTYTTDIVLFQTLGPANVLRNRLEDFEALKNLQREVNTLAVNNKHEYKTIRLIDTNYS